MIGETNWKQISLLTKARKKMAAYIAQKLHQVFKKLFRLYFAVIYCKSWEDFNSVTLMMPQINFSNVTKLLLVYLDQFTLIVDGALYSWINTRFLLIPRTTLGPFIHTIHFLCATFIVECTLFRSYCLYKTVRSGKSSIVWHTVSDKVEQSDHPKSFKAAHFFFFQMTVGAGSIYLTNHTAKLLEWSTPLDYVVHITWTFVQLALMRFTPMEVPYIYMAAYSCYLYLKQQVDLLLKQFREPFLAIHLVPE